jgi:hypothetical protein
MSHEIKALAWYPKENKIWGWFLPKDGSKPAKYCYAFWGVIGKTISIKRHNYWNSDRMMREVLRKKLDHKYWKMSQEELLEKWPDFTDCLERTLLFLQLSNGFDE